MAKGWRGFAAALALAALAGCGGGGPRPEVQGVRPLAGGIAVEDFFVGAKDDGIHLFIRNKRPVELYDFKPEKTVLFVHGATFPGHSTFDLALDGTSWMDWMAKRGYDVYALDIRGYGKSTRPPQMAEPPEANPPLVNGEQARADVSKAVDFILSRRGLPRLTIVGWSWGATLAGAYAAEAGGRVERLVLYSPQWLRDGPPPAEPAKLGAWRGIRLDAARERWLGSAPERERGELVPKPWLDAWAAAMLASDPDGAKQTPPVVRAPNGVVADMLQAWTSGKAPWQPERISVPTLVIQGEWDEDTPPYMAQSVFARLTGAPHRRYVLLGEATHSALLEKNRLQLFQTVSGFLEERF